jgi:hypothetical protein
MAELDSTVPQLQLVKRRQDIRASIICSKIGWDEGGPLENLQAVFPV